MGCPSASGSASALVPASSCAAIRPPKRRVSWPFAPLARLGSVGGRPIRPRESRALPPSRKQRGALRVLLVTQNDEELRSFGPSLHRERISVTRVRDVADAVAALRAGAFDAAIVSHPLPDADVIASCASLRQVPGAPPLL